MKPKWFCTAWISREKLRNCENSSEIYFRDFQTLCKEEGGDDGNFPRVASPKCLQKRFGSVWISAAFSHAWGQCTYSNTYVLVFYKLMLARILKGKVLLLEILTSVVVKDTEGLFWRWSISALSYCFTDDDLENQCSSTTLRLVVSSELLWVLIRYIRIVFLNRNLVDMLQKFSRIKYRQIERRQQHVNKLSRIFSENLNPLKLEFQTFW